MTKASGEMICLESNVFKPCTSSLFLKKLANDTPEESNVKLEHEWFSHKFKESSLPHLYDLDHTTKAEL